MSPRSVSRDYHLHAPLHSWTRKLAWHAAVASGVALVAGAESLVVGAAFAYALVLGLVGSAGEGPDEVTE
jgi:hypothetical protein